MKVAFTQLLENNPLGPTGTRSLRYFQTIDFKIYPCLRKCSPRSLRDHHQQLGKKAARDRVLRSNADRVPGSVAGSEEGDLLAAVLEPPALFGVPVPDDPVIRLPAASAVPSVTSE